MGERLPHIQAAAVFGLMQQMIGVARTAVGADRISIGDKPALGGGRQCEVFLTKHGRTRYGYGESLAAAYAMAVHRLAQDEAGIDQEARHD